MRTGWRVVGAVVVTLLVLGTSGVAGAQIEPSARGGSGAVVAITGDVTVAESQRVDAVVLVNGDVEIDGRVKETVFVVNGDVVVRGSVGDAVVALSGRVTVEDGADVGGDVVSSDNPVVAEGATVGGTVEDVDFGAALGGFWLILGLLFWVALTVSTAVLGFALIAVIGRRGADALDSAGRSQVGQSIAWGIGLGIGLPVVGVILVVTLIGLPLGLAVLFSLALVNATGYVIGGFFLGRLILKPASNPFLAFLLGWGILRVVELVPFVGGLPGLAATVYGLGMLAAALWRLRSTGEPRMVPAAGTPAPPPVAPTPQG